MPTPSSIVAVVVAMLVASGTGASPLSVDWPSYNNDLASARGSLLAQMTPSNVGTLHVVCTATLGGPNDFQTGPIVVDGVLYATRSNQTFAIDAATCATRWVNTYAASTATQQTRGLAFANGVVFRGFANGHLVAMSASTGAQLWDRSIVAPGSFERIDAAPIAWNGEVFIGTANGDTAQICHIVALDQATGAIRWSRQTVPPAGSPNAATWRGATHIMGGSMWSSFTVDTATGRLYVPVGNPEPDFDVRERLGSDLLTDSVLELDAATGAFDRGLQLVAQDAHDWDLGATPALATLANGTKIALVAGKDGYLRSVNIATWRQAWQTPVTTIVNAAAPITTTGTRFCPFGAVLWNGPAYSAATGFAYVNASDSCTTVKLAPAGQPYVAGQLWTGTTDDFGTPDAARSGWLSAIDAATGAVVWRYHAALPLIAGVTPTAGGLVFTADLSGNVLAFTAASGALLASVATGLPAGGGVIAYATAGRQYVAVAAGKATVAVPRAASTIVVLGL